MTKRYEARISTRGRITLPAEVRNQLGMKPGDHVEFVEQDGSLQVRKKAESVVDRFAGSLQGKDIDIDAEDIHTLVEKGVADEYNRTRERLQSTDSG
jgi:antitoxin PrlF